MKISVLIASNRPDEATFAARTVRSIAEVSGPALCPHVVEIVVCSPYKPTSYGCTWVDDPQESGSVVAFQRAYAACTGDVVQLLTDDVVLNCTDWWWPAEKASRGNCVGTLKKMHMMNGVVSPQLPALARSLIEGPLLGGYIFNPAYFHQHVDNDLGWFCHSLGIPVIVREGIRDSAPNPVGSGRETNKLDQAMFHMLWNIPGEPVTLAPLEQYTIGQRLHHPECVRRMELARRSKNV